MSYAIITRYVGPTNYRGSRIIATGPALHAGGRPLRRAVPFDYSQSDGNPRRAAEAVADALIADGWAVTLSGERYTLPDESGEVWPLMHDRQG